MSWPKREYHRIFRRRSLQLKIKLATKTLAQRQAPGAIEPAAKRRMHHQLHAAAVIEKAAKPNIRMQFDFYHVQIVGGDLIHRLEKFLPLIGHLQCAAVPSRHEPDEGEINYPAVFEAVDRLGYEGWIGAEYRPRRRTEDGLGWARKYGVAPAR